MLKIVIIIISAIGGYILGTYEPAAAAIRLGDLTRNLLYFLAFGLGTTVIASFSYFIFFSPHKEKLAKKTEELENAEARISTLKRQYNIEIEEHKKGITSNFNKLVAEQVKDDLEKAKIVQRREIEERVLRMFREEADRINGVSRPKENRSIRKQPISDKVETCRVSNGNLYAKLKEGDPYNPNR